MSAFGGEADIPLPPRIRVIGGNSTSVLVRISDSWTSREVAEMPRGDLRYEKQKDRLGGLPASCSLFRRPRARQPSNELCRHWNIPSFAVGLANRFGHMDPEFGARRMHRVPEALRKAAKHHQLIGRRIVNLGDLAGEVAEQSQGSLRRSKGPRVQINWCQLRQCVADFRSGRHDGEPRIGLIG